MGSIESLDSVNIMEPIHIFYKESSADDNDIFTADITKKDEVVNLKFKKSTEYAVTNYK